MHDATHPLDPVCLDFCSKECISNLYFEYYYRGIAKLPFRCLNRVLGDYLVPLLGDKGAAIRQCCPTTGVLGWVK